MKRAHGPNLAAVDLNLLVVLDALLREGTATGAAQRLGRTQSAISHSLTRLRDAFDDPLFVRSGPTLRPTPRAEALRAPLTVVLDQTRALLVPGTDGKGGGPDLARLERTFVVGTSDLLEHVAFPALLDEIARTAPGVSVVGRPTGDDCERLLQARDIDIAYVTRLRTEAGLTLDPVFEDRLELVLRRGHPALKRPIDLDAYCALRHVLVAPRGHPGGPVDDALEKKGRKRTVVFRTPSFTSAVRVVAGSDLVVALPSRYARSAPAAVVTRPLPLPDITHRFHLGWSTALDEDPAHRWFRTLLRRTILAGWRIDTKNPSASPIA